MGQSVIDAAVSAPAAPIVSVPIADACCGLLELFAGYRMAGRALPRLLTDRTGLTGGLSRALASPRLLIHDRGRVTADLACAIADGSEVISDFRVLADQKELFGLVASVPTTWWTLVEIAVGGPRALTRITRAVNSARRQAWAAIGARHGALPGVRIANKVLQGVTCVRLDATVTPASVFHRDWRHAGREMP